MITTVEEVEHNRARTEVKRDVLTNFGSHETLGDPPSIRAETACNQYGREVLHMSNMVEFWVSWWWAHFRASSGHPAVEESARRWQSNSHQIEPVDVTYC